MIGSLLGGSVSSCPLGGKERTQPLSTNSATISKRPRNGGMLPRPWRLRSKERTVMTFIS
jgi:hypothetical protein